MIILNKDKLKRIAQRYSVIYHEILLLLSKILDIEYSKLFFAKSYDVSDEDYEKLKLFLARRGKGEPIAKIIEKKEFYGLFFKTTKDTLDPRPETELIIDVFKRYYADTSLNLRILDLGSGTGCIGITLLKLYPKGYCQFVDISPKALKIAQENANIHNVILRSEFVLSNWFENVNGRFDIIVSNPPYVAVNYKLDRETLYDPAIALFAGNDGMDAYHIILSNASKYLKADGILILEIGYNQAEYIKHIISDLKLLSIKKDLSHHNRVCIFVNKN